MNDPLDAALSLRFELQDDPGFGPDFAEVRRRASTHQPLRLPRRLSKRAAVIATAVAAVAGASAGVAITAHSTPPVTAEFSAIDDPSLPRASDTYDPSLPAPARSVLDMFRELGPGPYEARRVGEGMYLGRRGDLLCAVVIGGGSQCTDRISGDIWLQGTMRREYDAETAPFAIDFAGFARDGVSSIRITTVNGGVTDVAVRHNAFRATLKNTSFGDIDKLEIAYSSGKTIDLDPRGYFPQVPK
jgi:hypothetical protein